jgi:hypothetical protein
MDTREKIEQYVRWFEERIRYVSDIDDKETQILCCCTLIDALARCVQPDRANKRRYVSLLESFGKNAIWTRVSIYHATADPKYEHLRKDKCLAKYANDKQKWINPNVGSNPYTVDPTIDAIIEDASNFEAGGKFISPCATYKFSVYFYEKYRCGLVHEARITSQFPCDFHGGNEPYYETYIAEDEDKVKQQLIMPPKFVLEETGHMVDNVHRWLIQQEINPYERHGLE